MPFAYYAKLSPARQRTYRKSDAIESLALPPGVATGAIVARVRDGLVRDDRSAVQRACQELADVLTAGYRVPKDIEFRDALPETLVGKVLRRVLQEEERVKAEAPS